MFLIFNWYFFSSISIFALFYHDYRISSELIEANNFKHFVVQFLVRFGRFQCIYECVNEIGIDVFGQPSSIQNFQFWFVRFVGRIELHREIDRSLSMFAVAIEILVILSDQLMTQNLVVRMWCQFRFCLQKFSTFARKHWTNFTNNRTNFICCLSGHWSKYFLRFT